MSTEKTVAVPVPVPALALALALVLLSTCVLSAAESLVLEGVHVVPMDRDAVLRNMTVVVEDGVIAALGSPGRVSVPPDARRIDARDRYVLPGLIEMHVHLRDTSALGLYLGYGFTTVRDMNGRLGDTLTWRSEVERGDLDGPRVVAAGVTLYADAPEDHPYPVTTPEQARRAVREMKARGYDLIKVYRVPREPFAALMDEAAKQGIPVAGHHPDIVHDLSYEDPLDLTNDEVFASGMVSLEHIDELLNVSLRMKLDRSAVEPLARSLRAHGVAVTTLLGQDFMVQAVRLEGQAYLTDARQEKIRMFFGDDQVEATRKQIDFIVNELPRPIQDLGAAIPEFSLIMLRTFHEAGVDLLIGTDSHSPLVLAGESALDEMDLFVEAGLEPYAALRAATFNAAKVLDALDELGTVAVGKKADLLLVDANPLESLKPLRAPVGVIARGRYYDAKALASMRKPR